MPDNAAVQTCSTGSPNTVGTTDAETTSDAADLAARERPPTPGDPDVATRSVSWGRRPRRTALFRVSHHRAILQHVRETTVRQRGGPSECTVDPAATLDDVPEHVLDELRVDGLELASGAVAGGNA